MRQMQNPSKTQGQQKRSKNINIKNIYVHKINSLIKISRDSLVVEEVEKLTQNNKISKRIKKSHSDTDKNALKLEKNRESARKARQRKNLYIKLLQNQVSVLKQQLVESEYFESSSANFLETVRNVCSEQTIRRQNSTVYEELDRYLSQQNLALLCDDNSRSHIKVQRMNKTVDEYRHWFVPQIFKGIQNLEKPQRKQLNIKIYQSISAQFEANNKNCKNYTQRDLRLSLPFEQISPEVKVANVLKSLNNNLQTVEILLTNLTEIGLKAQQLLINEEFKYLETMETSHSKLKSLITDLNICQLGDSPQKIILRSERWQQFPATSILTTMQKLLQFDRFVAKSLQSYQMVNETGLAEESQLEDQQQESHRKDQ